MANVTTKPALLVPGLQCRVRFTPVTGNFVRVWVTDAPLGSQLKAQVEANADNRVRITELKELKEGGAISFEWTFTPDKGGKYLLAIQEYQKGTDFGGGFSDDPDALQKEVEVNAEDTSKTVTVCQRLTQRMGTADDGATLVVYVSDDTIRSTQLEVHGEKSPAIIEPTSARATTAATSTAVVAALSAIEGHQVAAFGSVASYTTDLIAKFNAHRIQSGVHAENDTYHGVSADYYSPNSPKALEQSLGELLKKMTFHFENQDADQYGVGQADYHATADWEHRPVASQTGDTAGAVILLADLHRAYEAHRVDTSLHSLADNSNAAAALPPLLALHEAFISEVQRTTPDTPPVANSAATVLVHGWGFEEEEL